MKIVVLGKGYLGSAFENKGYEVLSRSEFNVTYSRNSILDLCSKKLDEYDIIINCIAKSNTRYCENNFEDANLVNTLLPGILSDWCNTNNKKYVHISTGCLYDKNNIPQLETDNLAAHCNYTLTKWMAEKYCNKETDLIIRPRLFFDGRHFDNNLLKKLISFNKLSRELDSISSVDVVVDAVSALIKNNKSGVFNVACDGYISMWEIANILGIERPQTSIEEIRINQGLHLVNNIMSLNKLKLYYNPPHIIDEVCRCWPMLTKLNK